MCYLSALRVSWDWCLYSINLLLGANFLYVSVPSVPPSSRTFENLCLWSQKQSCLDASNHCGFENLIHTFIFLYIHELCLTNIASPTFAYPYYLVFLRPTSKLRERRNFKFPNFVSVFANKISWLRASTLLGVYVSRHPNPWCHTPLDSLMLCQPSESKRLSAPVPLKLLAIKLARLIFTEHLHLPTSAPLRLYKFVLPQKLRFYAFHRWIRAFQPRRAHPAMFCDGILHLLFFSSQLLHTFLQSWPQLYFAMCSSFFSFGSVGLSVHLSIVYFLALILYSFIAPSFHLSARQSFRSHPCSFSRTCKDPCNSVIYKFRPSAFQYHPQLCTFVTTSPITFVSSSLCSSFALIFLFFVYFPIQLSYFPFQCPFIPVSTSILLSIHP